MRPAAQTRRTASAQKIPRLGVDRAGMLASKVCLILHLPRIKIRPGDGYFRGFDPVQQLVDPDRFMILKTTRIRRRMLCCSDHMAPSQESL